MSRMVITPVLSVPYTSSWSQVIERTEGATQLLIVFTVLGSTAKNVGKGLFQTLESTAFPSARELYQLLLDCVRTTQEARTSLQIVAVLSSQDGVIFAATRGSVSLVREGKLGAVLTAGEQLELRQGVLQPTDILVLSTENSSKFLQPTAEKLAAGLQIDAVITSLVPAVLASDETHHYALLFATPEPELQQQALSLSQLQNSGAGDSEGKSQPKLQLARRAGQRLLSLFKTIRRGVFSQLGRITLKNFRWRPPLSGGEYVGKTQKKAWMIAVFALFGLGLLLGGVWWLLHSRSVASQQATEAVALFETQLAAATAEAGENPLTAREQVAGVVAALEQSLQDENLPKPTRQALEAELLRAKELQTTISGRKEVSELPVFYDLRLIRSDFVATLAQGIGSRAVFVDRDKQQAVVLDLETKQLTTLSLEGIGGIRSVVLRDNRLFVLADGVYEVAVETGATPKNSIPAGDSNSGGQLLGAYESYLYVLNPAKRNIYRYLKQDEGYSDPVGWLTSSLGSSLDDVVSLAVDGDLWLSSKTGEIKRFTSGRQQQFVVKGLPTAFSSALYIVTALEFPQLYVLEPNQNRLVILEKDGTFLREIKNASLGSASALVVDTTTNRVLVLSGSMVFAVEL